MVKGKICVQTQVAVAHFISCLHLYWLLALPPASDGVQPDGRGHLSMEDPGPAKVFHLGKSLHRQQGLQTATFWMLEEGGRKEAEHQVPVQPE